MREGLQRARTCGWERAWGVSKAESPTATTGSRHAQRKKEKEEGKIQRSLLWMK